MNNAIAHGLIQHINEEIDFEESEIRALKKQEHKDEQTIYLIGVKMGEVMALKRIQKRIAFQLMMIEQGHEYKTVEIKNLDYYAERR